MRLTCGLQLPVQITMFISPPLYLHILSMHPDSPLSHAIPSLWILGCFFLCDDVQPLPAILPEAPSFRTGSLLPLWRRHSLCTCSSSVHTCFILTHELFVIDCGELPATRRILNRYEPHHFPRPWFTLDLPAVRTPSPNCQQAQAASICHRLPTGSRLRTTGMHSPAGGTRSCPTPPPGVHSIRYTLCIRSFCSQHGWSCP